MCVCALALLFVVIRIFRRIRSLEIYICRYNHLFPAHTCSLALIFKNTRFRKQKTLSSLATTLCPYEQAYEELFADDTK